VTRVVLLAAVVVAVLVAVYIVLQLIRMTKRATWPGDSPQYRNHLSMARWMERQLRDDMVQVSIPPPEKAEAQRLLEQFYGERQIGEGE
jgi:hypothetical protein